MKQKKKAVVLDEERQSFLDDEYDYNDDDDDDDEQQQHEQQQQQQQHEQHHRVEMSNDNFPRRRRASGTGTGTGNASGNATGSNVRYRSNIVRHQESSVSLVVEVEEDVEDDVEEEEVIEMLIDAENKVDHGHRICWSVRVICVLALLSILSSMAVITVSVLPDREQQHQHDGRAQHNARHLPILYDCPAITTAKPLGYPPQNIQNSETFLERLYANISSDSDGSSSSSSNSRPPPLPDVTTSLDTFRTKELLNDDDDDDGRGRTYDEIKQLRKPFVRKYFRRLKSGDNIYESSSSSLSYGAVGWNLLMTVEIVHEEYNTTNLVVYGNDHHDVGGTTATESVNVPRMILTEGLKRINSAVGVVCSSDSTNLTYVPSKSFDLVYSGYVSPMPDPLDIHPDTHHTQYQQQICTVLLDVMTSRDHDNNDNNITTSSSNNNNNSNKLQEQRTGQALGQILYDMMQRKQDDWYGKWVYEMTRIAKPGVPVIVERVSPTVCADANARNNSNNNNNNNQTILYYRGGVDKGYWKKHAEANTYHWDVDPDSIEIVVDDTTTNTTTSQDRYNVYMLKKTELL
jgi:hypothetical protein